MTPAPKRRWLRFSLRTMFVVVTAVCLGLGYQWRWITQRHSMLQSGKLEVLDDEELIGLGLPTTARAPGILWLFGERGYPNLWQRLSRKDLELTPSEIAERRHMTQLFPEAQIDGSWTPPPRPPRQRFGSDYDGFKL